MHQRAISSIVSKASQATSQATIFSLALQAAAARAWTRQTSTHAPSTNGVRSKRHHTNISVLPQVTRDDLSNVSTSCNNPSSSSVAPDHGSSKKNTTLCTPRGSNQRMHSTFSYGRQSSPEITSKVFITSGNERGNRSVSNRNDLPSNIDDDAGANPSPATGHERATRRSVSWKETAPSRQSTSSQPSFEPGRKFRRHTQFLRPTTPYAFAQNLIRLVYYTKPLPPLPTIIDYHNLHPTLHSTRSYNILLDVTLQHNAFASFRSLLQSMQHSRVERDLETWILEVRYLVRTGSWDRAWSRVMAHGSLGRFPQTQQNTIPVPIWVEFFALPRRGVTRTDERTNSRRHEDEDQHPDATDLSPSFQVTSSLWNNRLKVLFDNAPKDLTNLQQIRPHVIRGIVSLLLRLQHRTHALQLTKAYFQALPRDLSSVQARYSTDILNLHVAFGSPNKGLQKLWDSKKLVRSLVCLHPGLQPDSKTLFLLLSPLQRVKRCGSTAQSVVEGFSRLYGETMVDARVTRRIIHLALKEGRLDLVKKYKRLSETSIRSPGREELRREPEKLPMLLRLPRRRLFKREGRERFHWRRLRRRVYFRLRRK